MSKITVRAEMKSPHRYLALASLVIVGSAQSLLGTTVTNTGDSGPGSLRNAIANAINGETINFNPALNGIAGVGDGGS